MSRVYRTILLLLVISPATSLAWTWTDLWLTKDQQAQQLMQQNKYKEAKKTFLRKDWQAAAAYRSGDYEESAKKLSTIDEEEAHYNRGNALAHMGKYEESIAAYNKALAINPNNQDALHNRKIIEDLLKKEKKEQQDKQNQDKQNQDKQNQDKQNQDKQNQDKQEIGEASKEKKNQEEAKEQWLRLIPDDPSGLMREKLLRDHLRRQNGWNQ
ncbi:tetratricopeptide repeat protein [Legionella adelaidensis]|uniref:tetratricopeptide repeat protein n=1 Tax=Legionella adelaidensis TaxID=45056 RepID=UPI00104198D3|nr:tetratricopeptide repeat protein [Legionella adelaidensis]